MFLANHPLLLVFALASSVQGTNHEDPPRRNEAGSSSSSFLWVPGPERDPVSPESIAWGPLDHLEGFESATRGWNRTVEPSAWADWVQRIVRTADEPDVRLHVSPTRRRTLLLTGSTRAIGEAHALTEWFDRRLAPTIEVELEVLEISGVDPAGVPHGIASTNSVEQWLQGIAREGRVRSRRTMNGVTADAIPLALGGVEARDFIREFAVEIACGGVQFHPEMADYETGCEAWVSATRTPSGHSVTLHVRIDEWLSDLPGAVGLERRTMEGHEGPFYEFATSLDLHRPRLSFLRLALETNLPEGREFVTLVGREAPGASPTTRVLRVRLRDARPVEIAEVGDRAVAWRPLPIADLASLLPKVEYPRSTLEWGSFPLPEPISMAAYLETFEGTAASELEIEPLAGGLVFAGSRSAVERCLAAWDERRARSPLPIDLELRGARETKTTLRTAHAAGSGFLFALGEQLWLRVEDLAEIACSTESRYVALESSSVGHWIAASSKHGGVDDSLVFDLVGRARSFLEEPREVHPSEGSPLALDLGRSIHQPVRAFGRVGPDESLTFGSTSGGGPWFAGTLAVR